MARRGTEQRQLLAQLNVRLPRTVLLTVKQQASVAGLSDAAWVRHQLMTALPAQPAGASSIPRRRRIRAAPGVDVVAVARLRETVGEAVGTLRQVAGLDRERGGARLSEIDGAITRLIACARLLDDTKTQLVDAGDIG
jgi:hypothetical protein